MNKSDVLRAWASILNGRTPSLSIEITRECPLRCPGCYAYNAAHLGGVAQLRNLSDFRGQDLIARVLALIDEHKPLHVSLLGGDPLVRYRELSLLLPQMESRGVHTQVVTSAFREIPGAWMEMKHLNIVVSIDGLQPEHDARRKPATYERILQNIKRCEHNRPLHDYLANGRSRRLSRRISQVLERPARGVKDMVQHLHPTTRRHG